MLFIPVFTSRKKSSEKVPGSKNKIFPISNFSLYYFPTNINPTITPGSQSKAANTRISRLHCILVEKDISICFPKKLSRPCGLVLLQRESVQSDTKEFQILICMDFVVQRNPLDHYGYSSNHHGIPRYQALHQVRADSTDRILQPRNRRGKLAKCPGMLLLRTL